MADPAPDARSSTASADVWRAFDRAAAQTQYLHRVSADAVDARVQVDGVRCASCVWSLESRVGGLPGVHQLSVNATNGKLSARFDPARISFGTLLSAIDELGYRPHPLGMAAADDGYREERRRALKRLLVAGLGMMQVMMYTVGLYAGAFHGISPQLERFLILVSMLIATPVVFYSGRPFFSAAWRGLRGGTTNMDLPVAIAIGAAYGASLVATARGTGAVYFESVTMFIFLLSLGRFLEMSARHRAAAAGEALMRLLPATVMRCTARGSERVPLAELATGDEVLVAAGDVVPADGESLSRTALLDESALTGESRPRRRGHGAEIVGGTRNLQGELRLRVTRTGQDAKVAAIARLMEQAQRERPASAQLADRIAARFVAAVLLLAAATAAVWWHLDPARAFAATLAVLVITCPCALSLATPAALAAATTRLARDGILLTRARTLDALTRIDTVVFDKTGTLTRGRLQIADIELTAAGSALGESACLDVARRLEAGALHPIATAFASDCAPPEDREERVGSGVSAKIAGAHWRIGSAEFAAAAHSPAADRSGETRVFLARDGESLASFRLRDTLRPGAREALEQLHARGVHTVIASGDRETAVAALANSLGVSEFRARLSAADKLAWIKTMRAGGRKVAVVGDGINDAPVLAGADVSLALGQGTLLAQTSADGILNGDSLGPLTLLLDAAAATRRIVRQNIGWAIGYNLCAVPLAAAGLVPPWLAALGMSVSSLLVVGNAGRLRRFGRSARSQHPPAVPEAGRPHAA